MAQASYRVILTGNPLQDFDKAQVVQAAAKLFKCSEDRAQQFFVGKPTPIKREMDETTAQRYHERLTKVGIDCRIEPINPSPGLALELEATETSPPTETQTAAQDADSVSGEGANSVGESANSVSGKSAGSASEQSASSFSEPSSMGSNTLALEDDGHNNTETTPTSEPYSMGGNTLALEDDGHNNTETTATSEPYSSGGNTLALEDDGHNNTETTATAATTPIDTQFHCPKCNTPQEKGTECIKCGIIFDKYQAPAVNVSAYSNDDTDEAEQDDEWDEIMLFVSENTEAYRHKFRQIYNNDGKYVLQWHWPAFLINLPWLIFRKMYLWIAVFTAVYFITVLLLPWYLWFVVALAPGLLGNFLYYRHTVSKIDKILSNGDQRREDIQTAGGTNAIPVTVGITFLLGIILSVVMSFISYKVFVAPMAEHAKQDMIFIGKKDSPGVKTTKMEMLILKNALMMQKTVADKLNKPFHMPNDMDDFMNQMGKQPGSAKDYWDTPLIFETTDDAIVFRSAGPDKTFDTDDDIELSVPQ